MQRAEFGMQIDVNCKVGWCESDCVEFGKRFLCPEMVNRKSEIVNAMVRASGNAPEPGTDLVRFRL